MEVQTDGYPTHQENAGPKVMHPATAQILRHFTFEHLPEHLGSVSAEAYALAMSMAHRLPSGPELTTGLRKLLEAKDCFVRAALDMPQSDHP